MKFLKQNLSTLVLIAVAAVWMGISMGTDECPSCVLTNIAKNTLGLENDETVQIVKRPSKPKLASWSAVDTFGKTVNSTDLNGKVSVVVYWATWCGGCKKEIPDLVALRNEFPENEVEIIGLSVDEAHKDLEAFALKKGINYKIARVNPSIDNAFGSVEAIPTLFILDQEGRIQFKHTGHVSKDTLSERVNNLLASKKKA